MLTRNREQSMKQMSRWRSSLSNSKRRIQVWKSTPIPTPLSLPGQGLLLIPHYSSLPKITAHYSDVADPDSVNEALNSIIAAHGKADNLITSAGFTENFDAISYPYDRMKKLWGVNVDGSYLFAVGLAKHLMERKSPGSIVMIGSMSGAVVNVPQPQAPYNAAKAAIRHLAASLAVEWAGANIRVNCISPGYMLTAL